MIRNEAKRSDCKEMEMRRDKKALGEKALLTHMCVPRRSELRQGTGGRGWESMESIAWCFEKRYQGGEKEKMRTGSAILLLFFSVPSTRPTF